MKKIITPLVALALMLAFSAVATAQDPLKQLPADNDLIISIDLQKIVDLLPAESVEEMRTESMKSLGFDVTPRLKYALVGMQMSQLDGADPDITGMFMADISMEDIIAAAAKEGTTLEKTDIAGFAAYRDTSESSDDMYIAEVNPGTFVFGTKESLEEYKAVSTGALPNATTNEALAAIAANMQPNSVMSMAGVFTPEMREEMGSGMPMFGDLTNMVFNLDKDGETWMYDASIGADNQESLTLMKGMIEQYIPMVESSDPTGLATEVIQNMTIEVQEGFLRISGVIKQSTIDAFSKQIAPFMGSQGGDY